MPQAGTFSKATGHAAPEQPIPTIVWQPDTISRIWPGCLRIIDQTRLPQALVFLEIRDVETLWQAIQTLQVRGAPAIGIAAAYGLVIAAQNASCRSTADLLAPIEQAAAYLKTSRPTAVNLFWALDRMLAAAHSAVDLPPNAFKDHLAQEAGKIFEEDLAMSQAIGRHGAALLHDGQSVLTHCNAGGLATSGFGTALAPLYTAKKQGKKIHVYVDETRPLLQGARLTAWELQRAGIEAILICDNMAARVMYEKRIDAVLVGADRIAANGDAANKIGTYGLAVLAQAHRIPFYVLAPSSTIDFRLASGAQIPIEERSADEITHGFGRQTAPAGIKVYAPAFDVTPAELITAIICEHGVFAPDKLGEAVNTRFAPHAPPPQASCNGGAAQRRLPC